MIVDSMTVWDQKEWGRCAVGEKSRESRGEGWSRLRKGNVPEALGGKEVCSPAPAFFMSRSVC